jgi:hypothetical protein
MEGPLLTIHDLRFTIYEFRPGAAHLFGGALGVAGL